MSAINPDHIVTTPESINALIRNTSVHAMNTIIDNSDITLKAFFIGFSPYRLGPQHSLVVEIGLTGKPFTVTR